MSCTVTSGRQGPALSIITVVRNGVASIEACLKSIIRHASPAVELIVVDGGSTDGTVEILKHYRNSLNYWVSEPDNGIYDAMNKGLRQAHGDWILFIGCDDELVIEPEHLLVFLKNTATIYYGNAYWIKSGRTYDGPFTAAKLARTNFCQQAVIYPKAALLKHPFNLRYRLQADWEVNMRCFRDPAFRFEYLPLTISNYNDATGASTTSRDSALEHDYLHLLWQHFPGSTALWLSTLVLGGRLLRKFNIPFRCRGR
jgi:glycosyltransferase involved in cell wall biosynthesis